MSNCNRVAVSAHPTVVVAQGPDGSLDVNDHQGGRVDWIPYRGSGR
jgi:hypothetical protein